MKTHIHNNVWFRQIHNSWSASAGWRTDIQASVLHSPSILFAHFMLEGGTDVRVPMGDMRRALTDCPTRHSGATVGPFNVDSARSMVNRIRVSMLVEPSGSSSQAA